MRKRRLQSKKESILAHRVEQGRVLCSKGVSHLSKVHLKDRGLKVNLEVLVPNNKDPNLVGQDLNKDPNLVEQYLNKDPNLGYQQPNSRDLNLGDQDPNRDPNLGDQDLNSKDPNLEDQAPSNKGLGNPVQGLH